MGQIHGSAMRRFLNGQNVKRVLKKCSESRLQTRESTVIPLTSVQLISSQKRPQMHMTQHCCYEMSNRAGSWQGEGRREHRIIESSWLEKTLQII